MEDTLGILLQAGMSLDNILDMSLEQIQLSAKVVFKQKINTLEMVFDPIVTMLGGKTEKKQGRQKPSNVPAHIPEEKRDAYRDAKLMRELAIAGIKIY